MLRFFGGNLTVTGSIAHNFGLVPGTEGGGTSAVSSTHVSEYVLFPETRNCYIQIALATGASGISAKTQYWQYSLPFPVYRNGDYLKVGFTGSTGIDFYNRNQCQCSGTVAIHGNLDGAQPAGGHGSEWNFTNKAKFLHGWIKV